MSDVYQRDFAEVRQALGEDVFRFESRTVLIPGGNGFLGRMFTGFFEYLNAHVFRHPTKVISIDNFIVGANPCQASSENVVRMTHDLTTPLYLKLDRAKIDYIINCAGVASPASYLKFPLEVLDVSYIGTRNVLELAVAKDCRVLNFSSSECYGDPPADMIPTPETYMGQIRRPRNTSSTWFTSTTGHSPPNWISRSKRRYNKPDLWKNPLVSLSLETTQIGHGRFRNATLCI